MGDGEQELGGVLAAFSAGVVFVRPFPPFSLFLLFV